MRKKTVLLSQEKYAIWYTAISTTRHVRKARLNPLLMNFVGSATKSKWKCTTCTATKYKTADTDRLVPVARTGFADAISSLWSPSARYPVSASKPPRSNSRHSSTGHLFLHYAECFRHNASARSFSITQHQTVNTPSLSTAPRRFVRISLCRMAIAYGTVFHTVIHHMIATAIRTILFFHSAVDVRNGNLIESWVAGQPCSGKQQLEVHHIIDNHRALPTPFRNPSSIHIPRLDNPCHRTEAGGQGTGSLNNHLLIFWIARQTQTVPKTAIDNKTDIMVPLDVFDLFTGKFYVLFNKPVSCPPRRKSTQHWVPCPLNTSLLPWFIFNVTTLLFSRQENFNHLYRVTWYRCR